MTRSRLLLGVSAVLAGAAVLFVILGAVFNLILVVAAVPFGVAAYFLWSHATGRLEARVHHQFVHRAQQDRQSDPWSSRSDRSGTDPRTPERGSEAPMDRETALATLDLQRPASQRAIREAYRERAKAVHPDATAGDEDEFRRVTAAYEVLRTR